MFQSKLPTVGGYFGGSRSTAAPSRTGLVGLTTEVGHARPVAYITNGLDFPGALAAAPCAAADDAPVLLVTTTGLPEVVRAELERLAPERIVVVRGHAAVNQSVLEELARLTSGAVIRLAGEDRFATAAAVSASFPAGASVVYMATGEDFPDALAGAAAAGVASAPLLLVREDAVPEDVEREVERLDPARIVLLGGEDVIDKAVADSLAESGTVTRLAGADRYATAVKVANDVFGTSSALYVTRVTTIRTP